VFAKKITELRSKLSLSKKLVPGVSDSYLQKIENQNVIPSLKMILRLAKGLRYDSDEQVEELKQLANQQRKEESRSRKLPSAHLAGVYRASIGTSRIDAFRQLSSRAQKRLVIVGIGMTNLSKYAPKSLRKIASNVAIDLLMIDPYVLEAEPEFAKKLEDFLGIPDFTAHVRQSFEILRELCVKWNSGQNQRKRISFRVYKTIPTLSMVMIDPELENGEIKLEFFLYQAGEFRPRFSLKNVKHNENLFALVYEKFKGLWNHSRRIV